MQYVHYIPGSGFILIDEFFILFKKKNCRIIEDSTEANGI